MERNQQKQKNNNASAVVAYLSSLPNVGNRLICKLMQERFFDCKTVTDFYRFLKTYNYTKLPKRFEGGILSLKKCLKSEKVFETNVLQMDLLNQSKKVWLWGECESEFKLIDNIFWGVGNKRLILESMKVGIVGTRKSSGYGVGIVKNIIKRLKLGGFSVWSGFADGIDMTAHKYAIECGVKTVAVAPFFVGTPIPYKQKVFEELIASGGAAISNVEKSNITKGSFLERNKLLSKLVDILFVVEAPIKSGALHTAAQCLKLKKPVYVFPGTIYSESSEGCNKLLTERGVTSVQSLSFLDKVLGIVAAEIEEKYGQSTGLTKYIRGGIDSVSALSDTLNISNEELLSKLTSLELEGILHVNKFGKISINE